MILKLVILSCLATVGFAQSTVTTTPAATTIYPQNCSLNGVDVLSIAEGDFLIINQTIYDYDRNVVRVPPAGYLSTGTDVEYITIQDNTYVEDYSATYRGLELRLQPIIEAQEVSHPAEHYYYNFTIVLRCSGTYHYTYTKIPLVETNTFTPKFLKNVYTYTLFSSFPTDLERLIELDPIIANDDDISNTNSYFDLQYQGVVPNTLNKNHSASLVAKTTTIDLTETKEFKIFVSDLGFPRKSSSATVRIIPAQKSIPTFKRSFYTGDYYANDTFFMRSQPELEAVSEQYSVSASLTGAVNANFFNVSIGNDGTLALYKKYDLPELTIYKYDYLAFTLTVTYQSSNNVRTQGSTAIIIEMHHTG